MHHTHMHLSIYMHHTTAYTHGLMHTDHLDNLKDLIKLKGEGIG